MNGITNNEDMQFYSLHDQANQMGEPSNRLYKPGNMDINNCSMLRYLYKVAKTVTALLHSFS